MSVQARKVTGAWIGWTMIAACALVPLSAPFWMPLMPLELPKVAERPWEIFDGVYAVINWLMAHFKWANDLVGWCIEEMSGLHR